MLYVFAYGSNMSTLRLRARVASASPVAVGYVTHRRLVFHKRGKDGSAKADAYYTGRSSDRVWGVLFSIARDEKPRLDACELGYDTQQIDVINERETIAASIYVAQRDVIDPSLRPFCWYHRLVIHGAREHALPSDYIRDLQALAPLADPDTERKSRHMRILGASSPTDLS